MKQKRKNTIQHFHLDHNNAPYLSQRDDQRSRKRLKEIAENSNNNDHNNNNNKQVKKS